MSNQKQNNRPRGPMGHGMRGGGEKAKDFKGTMKKLFNYIKPFKFTFLIGILCAVVSVLWSLDLRFKEILLQK